MTPPESTVSAEEHAENGPPAHLQDFLDQNYEIYLIAGIDRSGKSQLLASYPQSGFLDPWVRKGGSVAPTTSGQDLKCYPIRMGRRKVVFMDAAGERFRRLYSKTLADELRTEAAIEERHIAFLRQISHRLKGLILLLDLRWLWGPERAEALANSLQVEILSWVLSLLRWLRYDGKLGGDGQQRRLSLEEHVNRSVIRMFRRLDIPVQVLFSKADCLNELLVPQKQSTSWLKGGRSEGRVLYPPGEDPLLLAYHCLPELFEAVKTHARHFRFDFVHSLVMDEDTGETIDSEACGVNLSLQWLLDPNWSRPWPNIPTSYWLGLQRFLDVITNRGKRWRKGGLPEPVEVEG